MTKQQSSQDIRQQDEKGQQVSCYYSLVNAPRPGESKADFEYRLRNTVRIMELTLDCCSIDFWGQLQGKLWLRFEPDDLEPLFSGGTWAGSVVWPASLLLCDFMRTNEAERLRSPGFKVIELGAGLGVPSLAASILGASQVVATEQDPLPRVLEKNFVYNFEPSRCNIQGIKKPVVQTLDWEDKENPFPETEFDLVLISDCIYEGLYGESWRALANIIKLLATPGTTRILNSVQRRKQDGVDRFLLYCEELGMQYKLALKTVGPEDEELEIYELSL